MALNIYVCMYLCVTLSSCGCFDAHGLWNKAQKRFFYTENEWMNKMKINTHIERDRERNKPIQFERKQTNNLLFFYIILILYFNTSILVCHVYLKVFLIYKKKIINKSQLKIDDIWLIFSAWKIEMIGWFMNFQWK